MLNVIMPTLGMNGDTTERSLADNLYIPHRLIKSSIPGGWGVAINDCLKRMPSTGDVLIIDDDVTFLPGTFDLMEEFYDKADVFGFRLVHPDGRLQHDGGWVDLMGHSGHLFEDVKEPAYVAYVTASLCYIKRRVIKAIGGVHEWPGYQWEDVALCVEAWKRGFPVMYLPSTSIHAETATKGKDPRFNDRFRINATIFAREYAAACGRIQQVIPRRILVGYGAPSIQFT